MDSLRGRRTLSTLSVRGGFAAAQAKARDKAKATARRSDTIGHLGPEAVVAFVDGEMEPKFMHRVRIHLVHCAECRADVHQQRHASEWVRQCADSAKVKAPQSLLAKLAGIAAEGVTPGPDATTPAHRPQRDFLDKVEMVVRAIKHNQRG
ncbi:anti-sigma factor family protein [Corynebacterium marquesiae]|uniref:anti-sigma factor family protein n=1 Tax=Corynebacterium marquesiae TaxID=2913503 RepID=UPI0038D0FBC2